MTVSVDAVTQTGPNSWDVQWSSDLSNPNFYIYKEGVLVDVTAATSASFTVNSGENLLVEILDNADDLPEAAFPGKLTLGWYAVLSTAKYRIDEFVAGNWVQRASIDETGLGFYQWKTRFLEDGITHEFRVIPIGVNGNEGAALQFSVLMVRHPDPPIPNFLYSDVTSTVTIS